jgi:tRNA (guanine-N7-)-methyltransferase
VISSRPEFQFYGRRKGKPLRRHHSGLMEDLLPRISVDLAQPLANTSRECWLEIGFGGGEHLAHQAALHPDVTLIGAEAFLNGVAKALAHIEEQALQNVHLHYGDARALLKALPDGCLARIYLLYPDPWPKERQKRRRFVNEEHLTQFHRLLGDDGHFLFASDIHDYVEWTRERVQAHGGFEAVRDSETPFENWITTRYEAKAKREGRISRYLSFQKRTLD